MPRKWFNFYGRLKFYTATVWIQGFKQQHDSFPLFSQCRTHQDYGSSSEFGRHNRPEPGSAVWGVQWFISESQIQVVRQWESDWFQQAGALGDDRKGTRGLVGDPAQEHGCHIGVVEPLHLWEGNFYLFELSGTSMSTRSCQHQTRLHDRHTNMFTLFVRFLCQLLTHHPDFYKHDYRQKHQHPHCFPPLRCVFRVSTHYSFFQATSPLSLCLVNPRWHFDLTFLFLCNKPDLGCQRAWQCSADVKECKM